MRLAGPVEETGGWAVGTNSLDGPCKFLLGVFLSCHNLAKMQREAS